MQGAREGSTVAWMCALRLLDAASAWGGEAAGLSIGDAPPGSDPFEARIPRDRLLDLWEETMRRAGDSAFVVHAGTRVSPKDYGPAGFVFMTQPNLLGAIHQLLRFGRLWSDETHWVFDVGGGVATLRCVGDRSEREGMRALVESLLVEMVHSGRSFTGVAWKPRAVRFAHPPPPDTTAHARFFSAPIEWEAEDNALVIDAALLDTPLVKADEALAAYFEGLVEQIARSRPAASRESAGAAADPLESRLRAIVGAELRKGVPSLEWAAEKLAMSPRTLRRRLQDLGLSFQAVLDDTRCDLAKRYLDEPAMSLTEVAFLLGFAEPSAFHRAFKRWTGTTPLAFRKGERAA